MIVMVVGFFIADHNSAEFCGRTLQMENETPSRMLFSVRQSDFQVD